MPKDYSDPEYLRFVIENIEREQERRMHWFTLNKKTIIKKAEFSRTFKNINPEDCLKENIKLFLPEFAKEYQNGKRNHRKNINIARPVDLTSLKSVTKLESEPTALGKVDSAPKMIPIDPNVVKIRYDPLPFGGRQEYLKERYRLSPENKYYSDETSNHVYGWRLKDSIFSRHTPTFGQKCTFTKYDLHNRTGLHPDPSYYKTPPKDPYSKCL